MVLLALRFSLLCVMTPFFIILFSSIFSPPCYFCSSLVLYVGKHLFSFPVRGVDSDSE